MDKIFAYYLAGSLTFFGISTFVYYGCSNKANDASQDWMQPDFCTVDYNRIETILGSMDI